MNQRSTVLNPGEPVTFPRCCVSFSIWTIEHGKQQHVSPQSAMSVPCLAKAAAAAAAEMPVVAEAAVSVGGFDRVGHVIGIISFR